MTERDEVLMARYADGDAAAFDEIFRRYEPRAYAYFFARTRCPERAQDLYQELFLRIHRARGRYDASRPFKPWFFRIAHRLLVDDQQRAHRAREEPIGDRDPRAQTSSSEDQVAAREQLGQVLAALSRAERDVVVAARIEGIEYPELAEQLGRSVDAVKKMVSRAVQRLCAAQPVAPAAIHPRSR